MVILQQLLWYQCHAHDDTAMTAVVLHHILFVIDDTMMTTVVSHHI